jgi:hypothetical protein
MADNKRAGYTYLEALADSRVLSCGEFLEKYPEEQSMAAMRYDEYEPPNI